MQTQLGQPRCSSCLQTTRNTTGYRSTHHHTICTLCSNVLSPSRASLVGEEYMFVHFLGTPNIDVYFGGGSPVLLDELCCTGTETSFLECSHAGVGVYRSRCTRSSAAAVRCTGMITLAYNRSLCIPTLFYFLFIGSGNCTFFTQEPQDETVIQDGIAQFTCSLDCMTLYYTTWIYDSPSGSSLLIANASQIATNNSKYSINTFTETLVVHTVTYADRGIYTCTTTSDLAVRTSSGMLTVKGNYINILASFPSSPHSPHTLKASALLFS